MDNMGAIQMVRNNRGGSGTRHVNVRFHFVREMHGKLLELVYVGSEDNEADMMCKNPTEEVFNRHTPKMVGKVPSDLTDRIKN